MPMTVGRMSRMILTDFILSASLLLEVILRAFKSFDKCRNFFSTSFDFSFFRVNVLSIC